MRKSFLFISLLFLFGCHINQTSKKLSGILKMPHFELISTDSTTHINSDSIPKGSYTILIYFSPDCEHCQKETKEIMKHIEELHHTNIYMIANDDVYLVKKFESQYKLPAANNVFVGSDLGFSFYKAYLPPTVPFMAVYNKNKELRKIYPGETEIIHLINAVKE